MKIPVIDYLLESEDYVPFDPQKHNKLHFNMARLVKDEIRSHKWIEAERGRQLTWEDAVTEWMDQHYDQFIDAIVPQKRILEFLKKRSKECFFPHLVSTRKQDPSTEHYLRCSIK
jgi:hypothetical protein